MHFASSPCLFRLGFAVFAIALLGSCGGTHRVVNKHSHYLSGRGPREDTVIVFVHGILGDSVMTWSPDGGKTTFPGLLTQDHNFDNADIFVVEYYTEKFGTASSIPELAQELQQDFYAARVFEQHKRVIFVCHSMGGLVVRELLRSNREYIPKVALTFFYGTPTAGAAIANFAKYLSDNPQVGDMVPIQANSLLQSMLLGWINDPQLKAIPSFCAYEGKNLFNGKKIVSLESAALLCHDNVTSLHFNHLEIAKPTGTDDLRYTVFANAVRKVARISPPDYLKDYRVWASYATSTAKQFPHWFHSAGWNAESVSVPPGKLHATGAGCAEPGDLDGKTFHDFRASFQIDLKKESAFEFLVHGDPHSHCDSANWEGYSVLIKRVPLPPSGFEWKVALRSCKGQMCTNNEPAVLECKACRPNDLIDMQLTVKKNTFLLRVSSGTNAINVPPFEDPQNLYPFGNAGLRLKDSSPGVTLTYLTIDSLDSGVGNSAGPHA